MSIRFPFALLVFDFCMMIGYTDTYSRIEVRGMEDDIPSWHFLPRVPVPVPVLCVHRGSYVWGRALLYPKGARYIHVESIISTLRTPSENVNSGILSFRFPCRIFYLETNAATLPTVSRGGACGILF